MNDLMTRNIYDVRGRVLVCGACLPSTHPEGFAALCRDADEVYSLCLEQTHINMAVTKLGAMLSTGQITCLRFASVDRSPHCTQLHYIKHELERMMTISIPIEDYVVPDKEPVKITERTDVFRSALPGMTHIKISCHCWGSERRTAIRFFFSVFFLFYI